MTAPPGLYRPGGHTSTAGDDDVDPARQENPALQLAHVSMLPALYVPGGHRATVALVDPAGHA